MQVESVRAGRNHRGQRLCHRKELRLCVACAEHGLACDIEVIAPDQVNEAYDRLLKSDVRYRFVIDMEKI